MPITTTSSARVALCGLAIVMALTACASPGVTQERPDRATFLEAARDIMAESRYAALVTTAADGTVQARAMDPFPPEGELEVWLGTNPRSRKVEEIRRDPRVVLYYFSAASQAYVTLWGRADLVNDPTEKSRRFKESWRDFYPDPERDYLLLRVRADSLEVLSERHGILGDAQTWKAPVLRLGARPSGG